MRMEQGPDGILHNDMLGLCCRTIRAIAGNASTRKEQGRRTGDAHQELGLLWFDRSTNDVHYEFACGTSGDGSKSMLD